MFQPIFNLKATSSNGPMLSPASLSFMRREQSSPNAITVALYKQLLLSVDLRSENILSSLFSAVRDSRL